MYKEILNQIANILLINVQHINHYGLLNGKLGVALFFYRYAKFTNNNRHRGFADDYVEYIYDKISKQEPLHFFGGLAGIGWGIDYAIKHKFVETEGENILEEVDNIIGKMDREDFRREMDMDIPLFSKGLYFIQKSEQTGLYKIVAECEELLDSAKEIPLSYLNSIFYFLNKAVSIPTNISVFEKLYAKAAKINPEKSDKINRFILLRNINNISDKNIRAKWMWLAGKLTDVADLTPLDTAWITLIYSYEESKQKNNYDSTEIQNLLNNIIRNLEGNDLVIYNGLAGLGLELIRISE